MAHPISLDLAPRDPRLELLELLEKAPLNHAEALLESYQFLQVLHDSKESASNSSRRSRG